MRVLIFLNFIFLFTFSTVQAAKIGEGDIFPVEKIYKLLSLNEANGAIKTSKTRLILVDFWASWCEPCQSSLKRYNQLFSIYKDNGFNVLAVNVDENKDLAQEFLKKNNFSFSAYFDEGKKTAEFVDLEVMPTSFLINNQGKILRKKEGYSHRDGVELEKFLKKELNLTSH